MNRIQIRRSSKTVVSATKNGVSVNSKFMRLLSPSGSDSGLLLMGQDRDCGQYEHVPEIEVIASIKMEGNRFSDWEMCAN